MDLAAQSQILELARTAQMSPVVLLGAPDAESAELTALTVTSGDPTFAGPLAGVQLGLPTYHMVEDEVASVADVDAYQEHVAFMRDALDVQAISTAMQRIRQGG